MASAAEQLAQNFSWSSISQAKELRQRIFFALGLLIIYRLGTYIPMPGIDTVALARFIEQTQSGILGVFNMFSGGAVSRMAIFSLGIMPYISASIIMQLMTSMVPSLEQLKKDGEAGRKKINQYTRYGTVLLATVQSYGVAVGLQGQGLALDPGPYFIASAMITLVGGTMFLMWLGEQITARGIGNGISLIIYVGIIAELPSALAQFFELGRTGAIAAWLIIAILVGAIAVIAFVVMLERAQRRIIVQYPKRQVGQKMYGGENSHLPLKVNTAGVIPPIFASSLLLMPTTIAGFAGDGGSEWMQLVLSYIGRGQPGFLLIFVALIVFFCFFYTAVVFNPEDVADNLKKQGGFVPGIRPGKRTAEYLDYVLTRLTVVGAAYLAAICVLPELLISNYSVPFYFGGTSVLIVVSVTMDMITQVQSHLLAHQYEGLIEKSRLGGGKNRAKARANRKTGRKRT